MQYDDPNADLLSDLLSRLERRVNLRDEPTELDQIQKWIIFILFIRGTMIIYSITILS